MIALFFGLLSSTAHAAPAPNVLVSIKPLHSIVAAVMEGAGAPELLLTGAASPHSYALKPSDARKIARADVIFWTGPVLETFLETPLANLAPPGSYRRAQRCGRSDAPTGAKRRGVGSR